MNTGTSAYNNTKYTDKEKQFLKKIKFSESLNIQVDMNKVKLDTIKPWIGKRITELIGMEDDVIEEFVNNQLEADAWPDPRRIQVNLIGFLNGKNARVFMTELWELLLSAQESPLGIPPKIIKQNKEELKKKMEDQEQVGHMIKKPKRDIENREGRNRVKSGDRYYRDKERERARERDRNFRDCDWERRFGEMSIHERDRKRDRLWQTEREEKSSPRRRKSRSRIRKSRSGSRRARSKSKRRPSGISRSRDRTIKDSSIVSSIKKDDTLKLEVFQGSLSRTPPFFKEMEDKREYYNIPLIERLSLLNEQQSKSSQLQISKKQFPLLEQQNSNDKKNSSNSTNSRPNSLTSVIKKKEEEITEKLENPVKKSDIFGVENPKESSSSDQSLKKYINNVKKDSNSDDDKVKAKKWKLEAFTSSENDFSKRKKKHKKMSSSLSSDRSDRDHKINKKDKKHKKHKKDKKHKKHKKHKAEESGPDSRFGDEMEQCLREKSLYTMKKKDQTKHDSIINSNISEK